MINASPDYIALKRGETKVQKNIQAQKLAEDRAEQEKLEVELAQKRQQEAAERQRKEENRREEERIRAEDEIQKAKDKMGLLSKKIHNELKSLNIVDIVDGVDIKDVCVCHCLSSPSIRQLVIDFIYEFNTVSGYFQSPTIPIDLGYLRCRGFGAAMEYPKQIKAFDKHRKSETPHIVVCDNICSDVVKELPTKKQSLNDFFRNR